MGNLDAKRDWGYAKDYVEMMWLMLQQDEPEDFVAATGKTYTVRRFVELAFARVGVEINWQGAGGDEVGIDAASGLVRVVIDPKYYRPAEVELLWGDPTKAREKLGWEAKTSLEELVNLMVDYDLDHDYYGKD